MTEPLVCAVLLTRGRPEMARRAVECFRAQAYERKSLLIWDTSRYPSMHSYELPENEHCVEDVSDYSIGELRNRAIRWHYADDSDIICHFDDDDWSNPNRISEQVTLLKASGADAVGYNSALFWDTSTRCIRHGRPRCTSCTDCGLDGEAWLYTAPAGAQALGASLMFWRKTWERQPFRDVTHGEDLHFQLGLKVEAVSSLAWTHPDGGPTWMPSYDVNDPPKPRLICTVHGGNTSTQINPAKREWKRAAEWDEYCRKVLTNA